MKRFLKRFSELYIVKKYGFHYLPRPPLGYSKYRPISWLAKAAYWLRWALWKFDCRLDGFSGGERKAAFRWLEVIGWA